MRGRSKSEGTRPPEAAARQVVGVQVQARVAGPIASLGTSDAGLGIEVW